MRKFRIVFALALFALLWSMPAFTGSASAATVSHQRAQSTGTSHHESNVRPFSSGGGCSGFAKTGSNPFFQIASCISANNNFGVDFVKPDAYAYFGSSTPALWSDCHITISAVLASTNKTIASTSSNCLNDARNNGSNVHYVYTESCFVNLGYQPNAVCVTKGNSYYNFACATGTWSGKFMQICARSPNENI